LKNLRFNGNEQYLKKVWPESAHKFQDIICKSLVSFSFDIVVGVVSEESLSGFMK